MPQDDPNEREVLKQAAVGAFNRRVFAATRNFDRAYAASGFTPGEFADFLCTCGREDCVEVLELPLDEYEFVQEKPYRFLIASGHATEVDDVILTSDGYDVVEVKPEYRELATFTIGERATDIDSGSAD